VEGPLLRARCRCAQCQAGRPSRNRCRRLHSPRTVPCRPGRWALPCCSAATARACTASAQAPRVSASAGDHTPLLVDHNGLRHLRGLCGKPCGRSYAQARPCKWCGQQRCAVRYRAGPDTLILTTLGLDCAWLQQTLVSLANRRGTQCFAQRSRREASGIPATGHMQSQSLSRRSGLHSCSHRLRHLTGWPARQKTRRAAAPARASDHPPAHKQCSSQAGCACLHALHQQSLCPAAACLSHTEF
jgi:hypothetical protein